ncbi:MAG: hypothetical protein IKZ58_02820 [Selenomonadaceae bacterium]|nr:hypothetical protein [Selenomonadaceae bacterium]
MATREENLKKINDDLEKLSDEELEQVAGGSYAQTVRDAFFMKALLNGTENAPKEPTLHTALLGIIRSYNVDKEAVQKAWDVLGIDFKEHDFGNNDYIVRETGKSLTQAQAWTYASKRMGRE